VGARAAIVERSDEVVIADIGVRFQGVNFEFRTRDPQRRPVAMSIRLERGPFRRFEGEWRLTEGRDGQERSQSPAEAPVTPAGR
jgi:ribosome-associated toxin RatA of RatAB toxin-antitoxin module